MARRQTAGCIRSFLGQNSSEQLRLQTNYKGIQKFHHTPDTYRQIYSSQLQAILCLVWCVLYANFPVISHHSLLPPSRPVYLPAFPCLISPVGLLSLCLTCFLGLVCPFWFYCLVLTRSLLALI